MVEIKDLKKRAREEAHRQLVDKHEYSDLIKDRVDQIFAQLIIQECMNTIRILWYEENNLDTSNLDKRAIGIHVGKKSGYITAVEELRKLYDRV